MIEHFGTLSDWENLSNLSNHEPWKSSLDVVATAPPPADTGSWFYSFDEVIILDYGWKIELLDQAAKKQLYGKTRILK